MRILLLGFSEKSRKYETKRLSAEFKKRGHEVTFVLWSGIVFSFSKKDGPSIRKVNGQDFKYFDYIIPRSPLALGARGKKATKGKVYLSHLYRHYLLIVDYINRYHKHVLNEKTTKTMPFYDKIFQHYLLAKNNLPVLTSYLYTGRHTPASVYRKFKMPYIVKSIEGSRGAQIFLIDDLEKIPALVEEFGLGRLLVQRYLPVNEDYRIIVIGNKVIGGMKRRAVEGDFRANFALGAYTEKVRITAEIEELALKAAKVFNAEFAGVDLIAYKGDYYILEVNIFPMFEGFEAATRINVAEKLAAYIERKYLWSIDGCLSDTEKKRHFSTLFEIEKQTFEEVFSKKAFEAELKDNDVMVVKKAGKPIAYLTHRSERHVRMVSRLVVANKFIGQRIGRRMLRDLVHVARREGDRTVRAIVPATYLRRQESFRRAGFTQKRILKEHFGRRGDGLVFEFAVKKTANGTKATNGSKPKTSPPKPKPKKNSA